MEAVKYRIMGSDYLGVFATATDKLILAGYGLTERSKLMLGDTLGVRFVELSISGSDLVGLFSRANSNGVVLSNLTLDYELERLKGQKLGVNIAVLDSGLNAIGNNILANDRIAIINPDYSNEDVKMIKDALDVEVVRAQIGGFKTVGANNILTNSGMVINNRSTDDEKDRLDGLTGFDSIRTTANTGSVSIGIAAIANSRAVIVGDSTTGYELARITEALEYS